ncbi:aaa family atpase [Nannochloropsis gaditana CCMP526]|uniref:aaa family atpase n=1 Tax=Nannochloropsis gaditana (strain CCMP526) TaxID=1093141 RepID=UPI00029F7262|nr:aaa family atpase [Nannochloropsis gaditana CCMP526]EKU22043.1 aaa family atpase [Nannochloropsis gaditana CCMP526]|eukprot:XP_005854319.1 aaa family atpase [Nannochloropsis gaditana CCMP526]
MRSFNLIGQGGILLCGPPGSGKTCLVKAAAASVPGLSFLSYAASDIYSMYLGEAEAAVRGAFALARQASPCLLFFDELDAIVGGSAGETRGGKGHAAEARVLSTFLNELDGVEVAAGQEGVLVVGATNLQEAGFPMSYMSYRLDHPKIGKKYYGYTRERCLWLPVERRKERPYWSGLLRRQKAIQGRSSKDSVDEK